MPRQSSKTSNRQLEQKKEGDTRQSGRWKSIGRAVATPEGGLDIRPEALGYSSV